MSMVTLDKPRPHVGLVTLNRPERLNAMSADLVTAFCEVMDEVAIDNDTWVVVITGAGRGFCSGLDLEDYGHIPNLDGLDIPRISMKAIEHFAQVVPVMRAIPQPILAAINGPAYGGGMCLSLGADLRVASESAAFNATGIVNGLTSTELGASWLLPRLIGSAHASDFLLTGRTVGATEAREMGLVSRVLPDEELMEHVLGIAETMCTYSPFGLNMTKQTLWANLEIPNLQAAIELENRNQILLGATDNLPECLRARKEKRAPVYVDTLRRYE